MELFKFPGIAGDVAYCLLKDDEPDASTASYLPEAVNDGFDGGAGA